MSDATPGHVGVQSAATATSNSDAGELEPAVETMYLREFRMERFRSAVDLIIPLQPTLTLLV